MLKALELHGFKSFADKTRLEFPQGITVVVGPNGSGKSNIVDAIKWVLGEQSAKSLRGKEMADVIFKGSAAHGRKPMNAAEATIVFDNAEGTLPIDAPEVHVTRRVFRSGEGEYLINRHPCRLRDVKDLCRGTGIGTDAYSIIEQGKVDTLLQASPRDRRAVFEEAAGISRFKAKKLETQRRLDRVDQNLVRLSDIVEEVGSRYRSIKAQAGKAQKYREYTERLKLLRTVVGMQDWNSLSTRVEQYSSELEFLRQEQAEAQQIIVQAEEGLESAEAKLFELQSLLSQKEEQHAKVAQRLATIHSASGMQFRVLEDLEQEAKSQAINLARNIASLRTLTADLAAAKQQLSKAMTQRDVVSADLESVEAATEEVQTEIEAKREQGEANRQKHLEMLRNVSTLDNALGAVKARIESDRNQLTAIEQAIERDEARLEEHRSELGQLTEDEGGLVEHLSTAQADVTDAKGALRIQEQEAADIQADLDALSRRKAVAAERASVLDELERTSEGVNSGVKEILSRARVERLPLFQSVIGLVADVVRVDVEYARMIEISLADAAQLVLLETGDLLQQVLEREVIFPGRVGLLDIESLPKSQNEEPDGLRDEPGVLGNALDFVEAEEEFLPVAAFLLGDIWFVDNARSAIELKKKYSERLRFVTRDGELLEADGRVYAGPTTNVGGIISRRSELRALRNEVTKLEQAFEKKEAVLAEVQQSIAEQKQALEDLVGQQQEASSVLTEHRLVKQRLESRIADADTELKKRLEQRETIDARIDSDEKQLKEQEVELAATREAIAQLEVESDNLTQTLGELEASLSDSRGQITGLKVELARAEQQVESHEASSQRLQENLDERRAAITDVRQSIAQNSTKIQNQQLEILRGTSEYASAMLKLAESNDALATDRASRKHLEKAKSENTSKLVEARQKQRTVDDQLHRKELSFTDLRHERSTLERRLRDDYAIEISEVEIDLETVELPGDRAAVDEEIADLRRKISNIGSVNMQALQELDEFQTRFEQLDGQLKDLTEAKESLEKIINKINVDSRRLFEETLETVRSNFQVMFRRVFGGGSADIIIEEGVDILEAGIDVIATPPGKSSLNISLLSGGERALTAVTLLLAIFQFRPSPFCILDEVDGPLDEANIGRFVDVLNGFLDWTRFVIVSHSKATMSAATTLHGVTMQESGISKRVSVRFDDVNETGDGDISVA
ncbi:chromosome segregation protein SMC [Bremerella cremea]|uniref:Chromosome partition protein Smc n=1 Tax=Blastopirellula marina TaxID=124 RepID=A0A2S8FYM0_9BACT|nr:MULTISPECIES: chromosome segregation protein SMC [Pirellulaceae]PQO37295.1 chromosome segregation protein SMC [Blastopirellula marina]RCS49682.1 chromosome segregation protein SMC [Bremerella cremea]